MKKSVLLPMIYITIMASCGVSIDSIYFMSKNYKYDVSQKKFFCNERPIESFKDELYIEPADATPDIRLYIGVNDDKYPPPLKLEKKRTEFLNCFEAVILEVIENYETEKTKIKIIVRSQGMEDFCTVTIVPDQNENDNYKCGCKYQDECQCNCSKPENDSTGKEAC